MGIHNHNFLRAIPVFTKIIRVKSENVLLRDTSFMEINSNHSEVSRKFCLLVLKMDNLYCIIEKEICMKSK